MTASIRITTEKDPATYKAGDTVLALVEIVGADDVPAVPPVAERTTSVKVAGSGSVDGTPLAAVAVDLTVTLPAVPGVPAKTHKRVIDTPTLGGKPMAAVANRPGYWSGVLA